MTPGRAPVVLGLDASHRALTALTWAAEEARIRCVPVVLAHAVGPTTPASEEAEAVLRWARHHLDDDSTPVHAVCRRTDPVSLLADLSRHAALVVVGAPDPVGRDSVVDTVAARLAARSAAPLVIVRGDAGRSADRPVVAALDRPPPQEDAVLAAAADAAVRQHRPLVAVHAGDVDAGRRAALAAELTRQVNRQLPQGIPRRVEIATDRPERALLERSDHAALLVLGIRRLRRAGPLDRLPVLAPLFARAAPLLGLSPLEEVLVWGSRCPVELVPAPA